ncbi:HAMP domain-containing sensor histidine kinase [Spirulina sp. CS-785/01]|uniref:sensor histidine kinase n=1 Tax=Spirulina sp. CS-785/01 TaxID=3021716 RepID=UPI00232C9B39|nr:HAMP domain-containing sensor histidine kinase [Spirulina sp. CS-785/01]MDB9314571.1 HAMP domain-containing sensor histidine kinase [Spirulina sp. CS-785/01]
MTILAFIVGLLAGLGYALIQHYRLQRRIEKILELLPVTLNESSSLPVLSRLRRAISLFSQDQAAIAAQLEECHQLMEAAPVGYLQVNGLNQLLQCNAYARQLLKIHRWQPERVRLLLELVRSYELDCLIQQTRHCQQSQVEEWVYQATYSATEAGEGDSPQPPKPYQVHLRASSVPLEEGAVGIFLENLQPLVKAQQERDRTFSDLAHELRTPLTSINLVAEALSSRLEPPEKGWVEQMLHNTQRLINLIQDCLELSHLQHNATPTLQTQLLDLPSLLFSAWETLQPIAEQKQISLSYHGRESLEVRGDAERLVRVFLNILDNSIKYSPPQGVIVVQVTVDSIPENHTDESDSWITIDIVDSGKGFQDQDLDYVFDRLYRGDPSRQQPTQTPLTAKPTTPNLQSGSVQSGSVQSGSVQSGSGLGLAIAQQIIQAHHGTIQAQNSPQTGGAWIQIKLPVFH